MTREEIFEKLKDILKLAAPSLASDLDSVTEDANLSTDLGLNSVGILFVVIAIEEFFKVSFDNVSFGDFNTVGDVIDYIRDRL